MSITFRAGLVVLGIVSLGDLAAPLLTDGNTPPMFIALIGCALGAISLALAALAWRGRTGAAISLVILRVLSAFSAAPAFLVTGVPLLPKVLAGAFIALTLVGCGLVLGVLRRPVLAGVR